MGLGLVPQQIPLEVTVAPPLSVIFPPDTADISVMDESVVVVKVAY